MQHSKALDGMMRKLVSTFDAAEVDHRTGSHGLVRWAASRFNHILLSRMKETCRRIWLLQNRRMGWLTDFP